MNKRIRTLWIPCLVSSAGAMVCRLTLQQTVAPEQKLLNHAGLPLFQQLIWLATLPLLGAASAYLSRRNGGERSSVVIAALFPSIVMVPFWMVLATKMYHPSPSQWFGLLAGVLNWIIVPGMALLLGALPFLKPQTIFQWKLNSRTRSFWFPALISLAAAMACLMASTFAGLQPHFIVRNISTLVAYVPWLLMLPFCGAAGAYFSRRGGGHHLTRLAAGLFPVIAMVALVVFLAVIGKITFAQPHWFYFLSAAFFGAVLPGAALLIGAVPLAKDPRGFNRSE